jgi:DNA-binding transcriptional LysR family regulator
MELHRIHCFLAVADLLHFGRAAERIHISQPALSIQIRQMEQELEVMLFERSRKKATLTYAGMVYRDEIREFLKGLEQAVERTREAAEGRSGRLRIGFISTTVADVVPPLISTFRKTHPGVELELRHMLTAEQIDALENGTLDVGFLRIPIAEHSRIRTIPIINEPFKLFLPVSHHLAERADLKLSDLDGEKFVFHARRNPPGFHDFIMAMLNAAGVTPVFSLEASDMYTLISLVSAGLGVAIAPVSLANYRVPGVCMRDLENAPASQIAVALRKDVDHPAARAFVDLTLEARGLSRPGTEPERRH